MITVQVSSEIAQTLNFSVESPMYTISESSLEFDVDETKSLDITFSPTEVGVHGAQLEIVGSVFGTLDLDISGEGTQVDIDLDVTSLDFGTVSVGQNDTRDIVISNIGTGTMQVTNVTTNNEQFTVETTSFDIGTSETATLVVTYAPTINGDIDRTLFIYSDDPDEPIVTVSMTGTGVTNISGDINGIWLASNSPYYIVGDTNVPDGDSLTIENGSEILFTGSYRLRVIGSLFFDGNTDTTKFMGISGEPILDLESSSDDIILDNVYIGPAPVELNLNNSFESEADLLGWSFTVYNSTGINSSYSNTGSSSIYSYTTCGWCNQNIYSPTFTASEENPTVDFYWYTDWYNYSNGESYIYIENLTTGNTSQLYSNGMKVQVGQISHMN